MTRRYLGPLELPSDSQFRTQGSQSADLAKQGILQSTPVVEDISTQPGDYTLSLTYRGELAEKLAQEASELLDAPHIEYVPFYSPEGSPEDGFYSIESLDSSRVDPRSRLQQSVENAVLVPKGSQGKSLRAVRTATTTLEHPFGNSQDARVGLPAASTRVEWFDESTGSTEDAAPISTQTGEHGDIHVYNTQNSTITAPVLVYDLDYGEAWRADVQLWDTRGESGKTNSDGDVLWQRCFTPAHDLQDAFVLDTRLARLHLDPGTGISFEEWSSGAWSQVSLPSSDWELVDVDLITIGTVEVEAQLEFENESETYAVNALVHRGRERVLYHVPDRDGQGAMPTGLQDRLEPTAVESIVDPQPSQTLVDRSEVRV